jgi:hypothetical protein
VLLYSHARAVLLRDIARVLEDALRDFALVWHCRLGHVDDAAVREGGECRAQAAANTVGRRDASVARGVEREDEELG